MKKNIFIIIVIALVCIGCGREKLGNLTQRGKEIHDSWHEATFNLIENDVIPAFYLDAWIKAPNDSARYRIEDQFFPYYKIRQETPNVYTIYNGAEKMLSINTYGQSLTEAGSHWRIEKYNPSDYYYGNRPLFYSSYPKGEQLNINKDGEQWRIQMDSTENWGSKCDWHIKPLTNDGGILFATKNYTLSGNGVYEYWNGIFLRFDIEKTITRKEALGQSYSFDGIVQLIAQQKSSDDIVVRAEYMGNLMSITYRGVTEIW